MTPTIIPADQLARVMALLSTRPVWATPVLSEAARRLVEATVGSACLGPVARDEYLTALARSTADQPQDVITGLYDPAAWDALVRNGLPELSDRDLLSLAASPDAVRELTDRVDAALCDGTLSNAWLSLYERSAARLPDPALDPAVRETFEVFSRLHAEWSGQAKAPRPTGVAVSARILLTRERAPLHMAAADDAEAVRFITPDGPVLEVHPSHRPGLSELCLVTPLPDAAVELLVDGVVVPLVAPFDRDGLATARTSDVTRALLGQARLELRFNPAEGSSAGGPIPNPPPEGHP